MALQPEYLAGLPDALVDMYSELEVKILSDIARRVRKTGAITATATWQVEKLQEMGLQQSYIQSEIAKTLELSKKEVQNLFQEAGIKAVKDDAALQKLMIEEGMLPAGVIPLGASEAFAQIINANAQRTMDTLQGMTRTMALDASGKLNQALDQSMLMVQSGAFTTDQAIDSAINKLSAQGLTAMEYMKDGVLTRISLEAGVRRAVSTGINQSIGVISENNAAELGTNLVEVTSHGDARPEHAVWQGKVYSLVGETVQYPNLETATGYGTVRGLMGANCRHSFYAYVEGLSDRAPMERHDPELYRNEQIQRYNERKIREWKKRAAVQEAGGVDSTKARAKISEWQEIQRKHLDKTGLSRLYAREKVPNFSKKAPAQPNKAAIDLDKESKPISVSSSKFNSLKESEEYIPVYRGIAADSKQQKELYEKSIRSGKVSTYSGATVQGGGLYTTTSLSRAEGYAEIFDKPYGKVEHLLLPKDIRVTSTKDLLVELKQKGMNFDEGSVLKDPNLYAKKLGYQGIVTKLQGLDESFYVLNNLNGVYILD